MAATSGRAALALAGWLLWAAALPPAPRPEACPRPAERAARAGHSVWVDCAGGPPLRGPARRLFGLPLDPNRADAATLETLPGIGPARAAAIVEARRRRPFARVEDLIRVRGIGPHTLARVAPWLAVREPPVDSVDWPHAEASH